MAAVGLPSQSPVRYCQAFRKLNPFRRTGNGGTASRQNVDQDYVIGDLQMLRLCRQRNPASHHS